MKRKVRPNVVSGGTAISLGDNLYYMRGKTHKQGGIDIGSNPKTGIEVENGEVVQTSPTGLRVFSAQPILNGISPANALLMGGNPNNIFNAQEAWKQEHRINDDGTKFKIGGDNNIPIPDVKKELIKSKNKINNIESIDDNPENKHLVSQNEFIKRGYPYFYKGDAHLKFYKKKGIDSIIYGTSKYNKSDLSDYEEIPYETVRKMLPKRDYIGGNDYRQRVVDKVPGLKSFIKAKAEEYGINPNLLFHRFLKEGIVDKWTDTYNNYIYTDEQKSFFRDDVGKMSVSGFGDLGLDDVGTNLLEGKYTLKNPNITWEESDAENEHGRQVKSAIFNNIWDGIEVKAAEMAYRQAELAKRGIIGDQFVNAAYNMGLNHEKLNDIDYVNRNYSVPNYYAYGGIHIKASKRGTFTAAAKRHHMSVQQFARKVLNNRARYSAAMVKKANFARNASKWHKKEFGGDMTKQYYITKDNIYSLGGNVRPKAELGTKYMVDENGRIVPVDIPKTNPNNIVIGPKEGLAVETSVRTTPKNPYYSRLNVGLHRAGNYIRNNNDLLGLGINLTGNLAASLINRSAIKGMRYTPAPIPISAQKLPTEVTIEPQVSSIRENVAGQERLIADNTADSRVALARRQRVRNQGAQQYQTLFGNKLNTELQLLTADRLNRQGVDAQNVGQYTQWRRGLYDFENRRREMLAENSVAGINNAAEAIAGERGYLARREARQQNLLNMGLIAATSPNAQNVIGSKEFEEFLRKIGYDGNFSLLRKRINV